MNKVVAQVVNEDGIGLFSQVNPGKTILTDHQLSKTVSSDVLPILKTGAVTIETLVNAQSVVAGAYIEFNLTPTTESEIWLAVVIDKQPWSLYGSTLFYSSSDSMSDSFYPKRSSQATTHTVSSPALSLCLGIPVTAAAGLEDLTTLTQARQFQMPLLSAAKARVKNSHATDAATVTVKILRVWK